MSVAPLSQQYAYEPDTMPADIPESISVTGKVFLEQLKACNSKQTPENKPEIRAYMLLQENLIEPLQRHLEAFPGIVAKKDENGKNILHHILEKAPSGAGPIVSSILKRMTPEEIAESDYFSTVVARKKVSVAAFKILLSNGTRLAGLSRMSSDFRNKIVELILNWACVDRGYITFVNALKQCIEDYPNLLETTDRLGNTLLHLIFSRDVRYFEEMTALIQFIIKNTKPDVINAYNRVEEGSDLGNETPLQLYCRNIHVRAELVEALLKAGADPLLLSKNWKRPIYHIKLPLKVADKLNYQDRNLERIWSLLTEAANAGEYERTLFRPSIVLGPEGEQALSDMDRTLYWTERAVRFVRSTGVIGAPNNYDRIKTKDWSLEVFNKWLDLELKPFYTQIYEWSLLDPPRYDATELLAAKALKKAEMLCQTRGGGDCFMQASLCFVYLYNKGLPVEHFEMYKGSHQFTVVKREKKSDMHNPETYGSSSIVCDPWAGCSFAAAKWNTPSQYASIKEGIPRLLYSHETINNISPKMKQILSQWNIELIPVKNRLSENKYTIHFTKDRLSKQGFAARRKQLEPVHAELLTKIRLKKGINLAERG